MAAPASYVVQRALEVWGVLDAISDALGSWLKINVPPAVAGWTIALIFVLAIYSLILWRVWRPRHIHHLPIQAETKPVATATAIKIPAAAITQARAAIGEGRSAVDAPGGLRAPSAQRLNPVLKSALLIIQGVYKLPIPADGADYGQDFWDRLTYLEEVVPLLEGGHEAAAMAKARALTQRTDHDPHG